MNKLILTFLGAAHEQFYDDILRDLEGAEGPHTRPVVYLLAASDVLRAHFWEVYDNHTHSIKPGCWRASWNTPETRLLIALAARIAGEPEAGAAPLAPVMMDALAWGQKLDEAMGFSDYEPEDLFM